MKPEDMVQIYRPQCASHVVVQIGNRRAVISDRMAIMGLLTQLVHAMEGIEMQRRVK